LNLQELRDRGSWFIFVDRFEQRSLAEAAIKDLSDQGLEAKVTVEAKSGDIFYRVQISGIENEAKGDAIMKQLRRSQFTDAKLRKTVG
jgi:cell division protein FtsN